MVHTCSSFSLALISSSVRCGCTLRQQNVSTRSCTALSSSPPLSDLSLSKDGSEEQDSESSMAPSQISSAVHLSTSCEMSNDPHIRSCMALRHPPIFPAFCGGSIFLCCGSRFPCGESRFCCGGSGYPNSRSVHSIRSLNKTSMLSGDKGHKSSWTGQSGAEVLDGIALSHTGVWLDNVWRVWFERLISCSATRDSTEFESFLILEASGSPLLVLPSISS